MCFKNTTCLSVWYSVFCAVFSLLVSEVKILYQNKEAVPFTKLLILMRKFLYVLRSRVFQSSALKNRMLVFLLSIMCVCAWCSIDDFY